MDQPSQFPIARFQREESQPRAKFGGIFEVHRGFVWVIGVGEGQVYEEHVFVLLLLVGICSCRGTCRSLGMQLLIIAKLAAIFVDVLRKAAVKNDICQSYKPMKSLWQKWGFCMGIFMDGSTSPCFLAGDKLCKLFREIRNLRMLFPHLEQL